VPIIVGLAVVKCHKQTTTAVVLFRLISYPAERRSILGINVILVYRVIIGMRYCVVCELQSAAIT